MAFKGKVNGLEMFDENEVLVFGGLYNDQYILQTPLTVKGYIAYMKWDYFENKNEKGYKNIKEYLAKNSRNPISFLHVNRKHVTYVGEINEEDIKKANLNLGKAISRLMK